MFKAHCSRKICSNKHSVFITQYSLLIIRHSSITAQCLVLSAQYSAFRCQCSEGSIGWSSVSTQYSTFSAQCSVITSQHSPLTALCSVLLAQCSVLSISALITWQSTLNGYLSVTNATYKSACIYTYMHTSIDLRISMHRALCTESCEIHTIVLSIQSLW